MYQRFGSQPDFKIMAFTLFCTTLGFVLLCVLIEWVTA